MPSNSFIFSLEDIGQVANSITSLATQQPKILLYGEMGAGKTTLAKAIGQALGTKNEISSPTYSIVNEYELPNNEVLRHIDLYRLKSVEEAWDIGIEDFLFDQTITIIEWPQLIEDYLEEKSIKLILTILPDNQRKILIL